MDAVRSLGTNIVDDDLYKVRVDGKWMYGVGWELTGVSYDAIQKIRPLAERAHGACPRGGVRRSPRGSGQGSERRPPQAAGEQPSLIGEGERLRCIAGPQQRPSEPTRGCGRCGDDTGQCNCWNEDM
jgi:hypothetical protein